MSPWPKGKSRKGLYNVVTGELGGIGAGPTLQELQTGPIRDDEISDEAVARLRAAQSATPILAYAPFTEAEPAPLLKLAYPDDVGYDLTVSRFVSVGPRATVRLPHNLVLAPPPGFYCTIVPRSSTMNRLGLVVLHGVVDGGFRGEVQTVVYNPRNTVVMVNHGERVSQLIVHQKPMVELMALEKSMLEKPEWASSSRGEAGFGSTD